jgi:AraC-like DNA-binding protein
MAPMYCQGPHCPHPFGADRQAVEIVLFFLTAFSASPAAPSGACYASSMTRRPFARPLLVHARRGREPARSSSAIEVFHSDLVEIVLVRSGGQLVRLDGVTSTCRQGDYGLAHAGTVFSSWTEGTSLAYSLVVLSRDALGALADEIGDAAPSLRSMVRPAPRRLAAAVDLLEREMSEPEDEPGRELAIDAAATLVGVALVRDQILARERSSGGELASRLARVEERLRANLLDTPTLDELATLAGLGRYQLLRAFRRRYGVPPGRYQQRLRAERARELLTRRAASASAVAADVGYGSPARLCEAMRRFFGLTPTQIARGERQGSV